MSFHVFLKSRLHGNLVAGSFVQHFLKLNCLQFYYALEEIESTETNEKAKSFLIKTENIAEKVPTSCFGEFYSISLHKGIFPGAQHKNNFSRSEAWWDS